VHVNNDSAFRGSDGHAADMTDIAADLDGGADGLQPVEAELAPFAAYNLIGKFADASLARDAIVKLERAGIDGSKLSYLALERPDTAHDVTPEIDGAELGKIGNSTAKGAALGSVGGAALVVATALIPGIGPVAAAGLIGAALGGGAAGGVVGGIWGGFSHMAASPAWDSTFVAIREGFALVGVHSDSREEIAKAAAVLPDGGQLFDRDGNPL
jgi:hypothetical protein